MFYQSRFYDSQLGRFTSADTIVPAGVQGYDRYAYVNNSPVNFTDPTGHMTDQGNGGNYTQRDRDHDEYVAQRDRALKCQSGNDTYCSYGEKHPVEVAVSVTLGLVATGAAATAVGAATVTAEAAVTTTTVAEATNGFCGGDMCAGEADELSRFFYSGGTHLEAETLAKAHNAVILDQTEVGAELTQIYETLGYNVMRPFAEAASTDWAVGASGRVDVILKLPLAHNNIWATFEYPALLVNDAVKTIVIHFIP